MTNRWEVHVPAAKARAPRGRDGDAVVCPRLCEAGPDHPGFSTAKGPDAGGPRGCWLVGEEQADADEDEHDSEDRLEGLAGEPGGDAAADKDAGDAAEEQGAREAEVHVALGHMGEADDQGENRGVGDIRADDDSRGQRVEEEQDHGHHAAGPYGGKADEVAAQRLDDLVGGASFVRLEEKDVLVVGPVEHTERMLLVLAGQLQVYEVAISSGRELTLWVLASGSAGGPQGWCRVGRESCT